MSTHKLKLKRTPEEEIQHRLRKARKKEKKRKHNDQETRAGTSPKRARTHENSHSHMKWASSDDDDIEIGPHPAEASTSTSNIPPPRSHAHKPDYDALKAEIEQQLFREKMFDAMGEDEGLDSVEARFNDYAQVPDRWRTDGGKSRQNVFDGDDFVKQDPSVMDDEEYAEWIRVGMYRKTHAEEYAEQQRQKAAKAARRAEEKARKAETARLEKAAEEERKRRKLENASRRIDSAREDYNARWANLLASASDFTIDNAQSSKGTTMLSFDDIPWPIATAYLRERLERRHHANGQLGDSLRSTRESISSEDLTTDAIASFLLPVVASADVDQASKKKERKDKLRETFLRFHPDKFEGRFMKRIKEKEREKVREAIGQVSRALNSLMGDGD